MIVPKRARETHRTIRDLDGSESLDGLAALTVDLSGVREADTTLVARLIVMTRRCREKGVQLKIIASDVVQRWAQLCRVEDLLPIGGVAVA